MNRHDEAQFRQFREQLVELASGLLVKRVGFLEGVRRVRALASKLGDPLARPEFRIFVAIDSDTDHLPSGDVRNRWSGEALRRVDQELAEVEEAYRAELEVACQEILRRWA